MVEYSTTNSTALLHIKKNVLATLVYFNMFNYPLRKREIYIFLGQNEDYNTLELALQELLDELVIFKLGEFYSMCSDYAIAERRRKGNVKAMRMLQMAGRNAGFISRFPFVRGVAVSGSLSKNYADDIADIDFFIITAPNRLWIARSFLHAFKKITFLLNMQHYFCMNYFVDEQEPVIVEKNIYTATEVTTLLPLRGPVSFEKFFIANEWTKKFLPNNYMRISSAKNNRDNLLKTIIEAVLGGNMGNRIDNFLMKMTSKSWSKKTAKEKKNSKGTLMALDANKHYAKPSPKYFQQKLMKYYENALADIYYKYEYNNALKNRMR